MARARLKITRGAVATALRPVVRDAKTRAKVIAIQKGLSDTGNLVRGIGSFARGNTAGITEKANRDGYPYPGIYEYAGSTSRSDKKGGMSAITNRSTIGAALIAKHGLGSGTHGARAFMQPAMDAETDTAIIALDELVGRICADAER